MQAAFPTPKGAPHDRPRPASIYSDCTGRIYRSPIRNGKFCVRKKSATSRPSIRKFPPALSRCKNAMPIRWKTVSDFARRNGRASLPRWMGKALLPKICGFLPMRWTNLWGRIPCALKCTAARMGKPKPILLIARRIAVSALPLKYYLQRSPKLKIVSIVRQMRSRSDWRDITIFQVA